MANIIVIGDGPAGLSAALFLAKNGQNVTVFGDDATPMHFARLYNYLGIDDITGPAFQAKARGQAKKFGAEIIDENVKSFSAENDGFSVATDAGDHVCDYLILAEGKALKLAKAIGLAIRDDGIEVNFHCETSAPNLYAVGRCIRRRRTQAIISAGEGAVAALDILSKINGEDFCDFDSLDDD